MRFALNRVPNTATPTQLPMVRKNVAPLVPTPRSRYSTAFCTASTSTCMTMPSPAPSTNMDRPDCTDVVSRPMSESR